jgi:hypothetical protein
VQRERVLGGLLVLTAAIAMIGAGCGDDDEGTSTPATTTASAGGNEPSGDAGAPTADEWASKADAICEKGDRKIDAEAKRLFADLGISQNEQPSPAQLERYVDDVLVPNVQDQIYDIFEIPQPASEQQEIQAFLDNAQSELHHVQDVPSALTGSKDPFAKTSKVAQELGLKECASD